MKHLYTACILLLLATAPAAAADIIEKRVEYTQGGQALEGFLAFDPTVPGKRPGILIVHQWKGIGAHEEGVARKLAALGYVAFAADIYGKGVRPATSQDAGVQAGRFKNDIGLFRSRIIAGLDALKSNPEVDPNRIVAFGYCFGGLGVLELARSGAAIQGVVSFHGSLATQHPEKSVFNTKVLVHHGADDPHVPAEEVKNLMAELTTHHADWQLNYYGGAVHAFTDLNAGSDASKGAAYNKEADTRSWNATVEFMKDVFGSRNAQP